MFENKKVFITSDLHFSHLNIIKYCNRPFEHLDEMNEFILKQFDELPDDQDTIIINNGDLWLNKNTTIEDIQYWVSRMKGNNRKLWIILGNHDREIKIKNKNWNTDFESAERLFYFLGFDKVFCFPIVLDNLILSHEPVYLDKNSQFVNLFGHIHDVDIDEKYFPNKKIDLKKYFNVCWDKHKKILSLQDLNS